LERNSEMVFVSFSSEKASLAVELANLYAREVVKFTQNLQVKEVTDLNNYYLNQQVSSITSEIDKINEQLKSIPVRDEAIRMSQVNASFAQARNRMDAPVYLRSEHLMDRLQTAKEELIGLTSKYTDMHPLVQEQQSKVDSMEKLLEETVKKESEERSQFLSMISAKESSAAEASKAQPALQDVDSLRIKLQALENNRIILANRKLEAQLFAQNPPGYCKIFSPATTNEVSVDSCWIKIFALTAFAGLLGMMITSISVLAYVWASSSGVFSQWSNYAEAKTISLGSKPNY
jgi:hypothetical protein